MRPGQLCFDLITGMWGRGERAVGTLRALCPFPASRQILTGCAMAGPPRGKGMGTGLVRVHMTPLVTVVGSRTSIWSKSDQRDSTLSPVVQAAGKEALPPLRREFMQRRPGSGDDGKTVS